MIAVVVLLALAVQGVSSACWQGWQEYNGYCYGFSDEILNWYSAASTCFYYGAHLAQAETQAKNDWLTGELKQRGYANTWLGGTSRHHVPNWEWLPSHKPMSYSNWNEGEPNNAGGVEHCLEIARESNYSWNDNNCAVAQTFICERKA